MRLLFHQAMKDLRAERWFVGAWAAVLLAVAILEGLKIDLSAIGPGSGYPHSVATTLLLVALALSREVLGWLLAIRIVHADPVGDANAFWLTRPLSRTMLMASKIGLLAVLFFVLPGLVAAVVFLANDVALDRLPGCIVEWWLFDAVLLLPFVLLASLTRDMARVGLAAIAGVAVWLGLMGLTTFNHLALEMTGNAWAPVYRTMALTVASFGFAVVVLSSALVVWHYRTRRTAVTAWAALASVVVLASAAALPTARFRSTVVRPRPVVDNRWAGAGGVTVSIPPATITTGPAPAAGRAYADGTVRLLGDLAIAGETDEVLVDAVDGKGTIRLAGRQETVEGTDVNWFGFSLLARLALRSESDRRAFERAVGARVIGPTYPTWNALSLARIKAATYAGYQGLHASYDGDFVLAAYRVVVSSPVPFRPGQSIGVGPMGSTVLSVGTSPRAPQCWHATVRESDPRSFLPPTGERLGYVLRNRRLREALPLFDDSYPGLALGLTSTFLTLSRATLTPDCSSRWVSSAEPRRSPVDQAWLADAELLLVTVEPLGTFRRHVEVRDFVMPKVTAQK